MRVPGLTHLSISEGTKNSPYSIVFELLFGVLCERKDNEKIIFNSLKRFSLESGVTILLFFGVFRPAGYLSIIVLSSA